MILTPRGELTMKGIRWRDVTDGVKHAIDVCHELSGEIIRTKIKGKR